jgi:hypothetical protein
MAIQPELIAAVQGGDENAIALLLARAQPDIRRYAQYNELRLDLANAIQSTTIVAS